MRPTTHVVFSVVASLVVVVTIVYGLELVGTPRTARLQRFDQQRLEDLQTIFREIQSLCQDPDTKNELKRPLPQSLDGLAAQARSERINLNDPATRRRYIYTVRSGKTYELCATFSFQRDSDESVFWNHPSGAHCFIIDVLDPPQ